MPPFSESLFPDPITKGLRIKNHIKCSEPRSSLWGVAGITHLSFTGLQPSLLYKVLLSVTLEKGMATHSSTLVWRILWTEEPGGLVHGVAESDTSEHSQCGKRLLKDQHSLTLVKEEAAGRPWVCWESSVSNEITDAEGACQQEPHCEKLPCCAVVNSSPLTPCVLRRSLSHQTKSGSWGSWV